MIYVSTSCIKNNSIKDSVLQLVNNGYLNIELSGGTNFYENYLQDLLFLKKKFNLNYSVHNYFPPPKNHFVLNIASMNDYIYNKTIEYYFNSIDVCKLLGCQYYSIHPGFLIDISLYEVGKKISKNDLFDKKNSIKRLSKGFKILNDYAGKDFQIYIENNVLSKNNLETFYKLNPFLLTDYHDYLELKGEF